MCACNIVRGGCLSTPSYHVFFQGGGRCAEARRPYPPPPPLSVCALCVDLMQCLVKGRVGGERLGGWGGLVVISPMYYVFSIFIWRVRIYIYIPGIEWYWYL